MNWFWDNIHLKREDRLGMIVFLCFIFLLLFVKWYLVVIYQPDAYIDDIISNDEYTIIRQEEDEKKKVTRPSKSAASRKAKTSKKSDIKRLERKNKSEKKLFHFDPNTIGFDSLELLGFSKYASNNIVKYRSKGGQFNKVGDLYKIYGVDSALVVELNPFIKINQKKKLSKSTAVSKRKSKLPFPKLELKSIDINRADTTDFKRLRGIGSVYANRIVKFRNSLGGYFTIQQISDVWGISDSLYFAIEPFLTIDTSLVKKKNINSLNKELLVKHPYIDWKKAKAILKYKKMHGDYSSMDDFKKLHGIDSDFVDTLRLYFVAQ